MNQSDPRVEQSLNDRLKHLAIQAQQSPPQSRQRQQALSQLLSAILQSGQLSRPRRNQFQGFYQEIYAEAVQRLCSYICEKIDRYSPERGEVLQWVNFLLNQRFFIEASREVLPVVYQGIDPRKIQRISLDELDRHNPDETNPHLTPSLSQEVVHCLEEDPEGIFQTTHVVNHPSASFQRLALCRLAGYSWQDISAEFDISTQTLSSFYQRCLAKFAPKFKQYLL